MGRRRVCPDPVVERVAELRWRGLSLRQICTTMQDEGVTTPTGKARWWPETVNKLLRTTAGRAATTRLSMAAEVGGDPKAADPAGGARTPTAMS